MEIGTELIPINWRFAFDPLSLLLTSFTLSSIRSAFIFGLASKSLSRQKVKARSRYRRSYLKAKAWMDFWVN